MWRPADMRERIRRTISVTDAECIPKVEGAGEVFREGEVTVQRMHNGVKVAHGSYHGEWMAEIIRRLRGHHEPQEERIFYEVLRHVPDRATMIECGAFWAYYSLWFMHGHLVRRCYLIEPVPTKRAVGQHNFGLNGMEGEFTAAFLGSSYQPEAVFVDHDGSRYEVPRISIDWFMEERSIPHVDVLHSDIQGAEVDMLEGARAALAARRIGYLFISTHGDTHRPCVELLRAAGYAVQVQHTMDESCSVDGLIFARSAEAADPGPIEITRLAGRRRPSSRADADAGRRGAAGQPRAGHRLRRGAAGGAAAGGGPPGGRRRAQPHGQRASPRRGAGGGHGLLPASRRARPVRRRQRLARDGAPPGPARVPGGGGRGGPRGGSSCSARPTIGGCCRGSSAGAGTRECPASTSGISPRAACGGCSRAGAGGCSRCGTRASCTGRGSGAGWPTARA